MHFATHALLSLILARALFARKVVKHGWPLLGAIILAGTLADLDLLAALFGPAAYLAGRYTITHSLPGTLAIICVATIIFRVLDKHVAPNRNGVSDKNAVLNKNGALARNKLQPLLAILTPLSLAAALHLLLDFFSASGVALFWPFRLTRYSADWLPNIDPWLLALLIAGLLLPELRRLITSEIGAKDKTPRGQTGARVVLVMLLLYIGARFLLHSSSLSLLESRVYRGESPAHIAALPDAFSPVLWSGIVETQSMFCTVAIPLAGKPFDSETARCQHKPDISPALATAQQTEVAKKYLLATHFPRAFVVSTADGSAVVIRSMRDFAQGDPPHAVAAQILLDIHSRIVSEQIVWAVEIHER